MQIELQVGHEVAFLADGHKKSSSKPEKSAVADLENAARFPTHTRTHILTFIYRFPLYKVTKNTVDAQNAPPVSKYYTESRGHSDLIPLITEICDHSRRFWKIVLISSAWIPPTKAAAGNR